MVFSVQVPYAMRMLSHATEDELETYSFGCAARQRMRMDARNPSVLLAWHVDCSFVVRARQS